MPFPQTIFAAMLRFEARVITGRRLPARWFFVFLLVAIAPLIHRALLMLERSTGIGVDDARGFLADLAVSALIALVLEGCAAIPWRPGRAVGLLVLGLWLAMTVGNYEHIRALGTLVSWVYAAFLVDPTFLGGSALRVAHPLLLAILAIVTMLLWWWSAFRWPAARSVLGGAVTSIILCVAIWAWPVGGDVAVWRQQHYVFDNLRWVGQSQVSLEPSDHVVHGLYPADFQGTPIVELDNTGTNILLVVLEGVSGGYVESTAKMQGVPFDGPSLPSLDAIARENISYVNFLNHQRQTNRGLYSLLCGALPKLTTLSPKMSDLVMAEEQLPCLPAALRAEGYHTAFIQSAPLGFMGKDRFIPAAGFEEVHGIEWFEDGATLSEWGANDHAFFEKIPPYLEGLQEKGAPWFVTLLTAGTHHPFNVPKNFESGHPEGSFAHAVAYLATAIEPFFKQLQQSNLPENTLVIFTSDESFGTDGGNNVDSQMLAQAFGTLTVVLPKPERMQVREPFMQMDVAVSILDFLGYRSHVAGMGGRSVFRSYETPRALPFANTYMRMSGAITPERDAILCWEDFSACRKYRLDPDRLFAPKPKRIVADPDDATVVSDLVRRSLHTGDHSMKNTWALTTTPKEMALVTKRLPAGEIVTVFSHQYLPVPANTRLYVDIEVKLLGAEGTLVGFMHEMNAHPTKDMPSSMDFAYYANSEEKRKSAGLKGDSKLGMRPSFSHRERFYKKLKDLTPGDSLTLHYSVDVDEDMERLNCSLVAKVKEGEAPSLHIERATLRMEPLDGRPNQGLKIGAAP